MRGYQFALVSLGIVFALACQSNEISKPVSPTISPASNTTADPNQTIKTSEPQRVSIESPDKTIIVGSFYESPKPNSSAILLLHQWQSDRHSFDDFAKRMQAKGFNVLAIDGRGFGESVKTADGKAVGPERADAAVKAMLGDVGAAIEYLAKAKSVDPDRIGIVGASYGSSLAVIYAADHPNIKSVALLSPGLNYFGNMQTEPAVEKYGNRPLFAVAAVDDSVSADAVTKLGSAKGPPSGGIKSHFAVVMGGEHGTSLLNSDAQVEKDLEDFLTATL
jgi:dienelactone hydrolase